MSAPVVDQVHNTAPEKDSDCAGHLEANLNNKRSYSGFLHRVTDFLVHYGVETHGITPIPAAERTDTRWYQMFTVWFSSDLNVIIFSVGTAGPAFFSLGVRDAIAIIVVTDVVFSLAPAYCAVFGPKLGTRAMVQSRFSWGYYGSIIPSVLNVLTMEGYLVLNSIIGGQTLAGLSSHLSETLGIVIISVISLVVTFFGYRFLHWYESVVWIPNVIAFIAMLVVGYPQLHANLYVSVPAPPLRSVLSFASTIASTIISMCTMTPDYGVYHSPAASSTRIFLYVYLGFLIPSLICHILGAAFAAAAPNVPVWNTTFQNGSSAGGLMYGVLSPLGGFGKFLTVLVALTVPSASTLMMYTFSTSLMSASHWFTLTPRWVFVLISESILIPVAIIAAQKFYTTLVNMLNIIGYWSTAFSGIVITEHILFRGGRFSETAYLISTWNVPGLLPRSTPAVLAFLVGCGALVPFMSQVWYVGPVAKAGSGDCGVYVGFIVSALSYALLRGLERWQDRKQEREVNMNIKDGLNLLVA